MKILKLQKVEHTRKIGQNCEYFEPNIKEDCFLEVDGEIIGFYIKDIEKYSIRLKKLLNVANTEFQSDNVPKSAMVRATVPTKEKYELLKKLNNSEYDEVPEQIKRWNKAGGKVLEGLVRRREAEALLFSGKSWNEV